MKGNNLIHLYNKVFSIISFLTVLLLPGGYEQGQGYAGAGMQEVKTTRREPVAVYQLPDFSRYGIAERKKMFFDFIGPIIRDENQRIREDKWKFRKLYARSLNGYNLSGDEIDFVTRLMDEYRVKGDYSDNFTWEVLMERIDVVPLPLASVQAAIESGWGTSRFARVGNNLFGQWCFRESCGIVPDQRPEGDIYEVATFGTVNESVRSYLRNLNTFSAYQSFRSLRLRQRLEEGSLNSYQLAEGLRAYSTRRGEYIDEIRLMLRVNSEFFEDFCYETLLAESDKSSHLLSQGGTGISH
jgi:Bax protein